MKKKSFAGLPKSFTCIALLVILLASSVYICFHIYSNRRTRPNIFIILIDALREDHLGCYGYYRDTSPHIDEFARDSKKFEGVISACSWTSPSIASLFTSLYVSSHGLMTHSQKCTDILNPQFETLAEALKKKGYTTAAFIANRWIREEFNYNQGFDTFEQVGGDIPRPGAAAVKERVILWLKDRPKQPFFAYIHFMDVHGPYYPPYPYNTFFTRKNRRELTDQEYNKLRYLKYEGQRDLNFYISQYDGGIRYCDYNIGKIMQYLREAGLYNDSVIILTSDHGEAFFEHGECDHGFTLYNEEIRVPLIIRLPPSASSEINDCILPQLIDIGVTILDMIGARFPYDVDGLSLLCAIKKGKVDQWRDAQFSEEYMKGFPKAAMIKEGIKYIYNIFEGRIVEVYDMADDDREQNNLAAAHSFSDFYACIEKQIQEWLTGKECLRNKISGKRDRANIDARTLEQLKSLGYIQPASGVDN
ncbi:sulfatase [bacterium]|nr:sulfatase [bacterium]